MRRLVCCLALLGSMAQDLPAQDVEFFGGYSFLRLTGNNYQKIGLNGWNASVATNRGSWGVVADFSNHYGANLFDSTPIGSGGHGATYLFGPQYSFRRVPKVTPFAHALFGEARGVGFAGFLACPQVVGPQTAPACGPLLRPESAFAMALGGGIDVRASRHVWIRVAQVDYVRENFSLRAVNSPRLSAGVVLRFGSSRTK